MWGHGLQASPNPSTLHNAHPVRRTLPAVAVDFCNQPDGMLPWARTCPELWAAEIYTEHGGVVTTVSDAVGAVHNPKGLDILALRRHIAEGNKLVEFSGGEGAVSCAHACERKLIHRRHLKAAIQHWHGRQQ